MTNQQVILNDKVRALNLQINSQLRSNGILNHKGKNVKSLLDEPESEWKLWILELIKLRDELDQQGA